jgi:hypothetical protein
MLTLSASATAPFGRYHSVCVRAPRRGDADGDLACLPPGTFSVSSSAGCCSKVTAVPRTSCAHEARAPCQDMSYLSDRIERDEGEVWG